MDRFKFGRVRSLLRFNATDEQREEVRVMLNGLHGAPNAEPPNLLQRISDLEHEVNQLTRQHALDQQRLQDADARHRQDVERIDGQAAWITKISRGVTLSTDAPPNRTDLVPFDQAEKSLKRVVNTARADIALVAAIGELRRVVQHVETLAVYCPIGALPAAFVGLVKELGGLQAEVIAAAADAEIDPDNLRLLNKYISQRIEGVRKTKHDGGHMLRQIIAETSEDFKVQAQAAIAKARQGRHIEPLTQRVHDYAVEFKYEGDRTWEKAGRALVDDLCNRASSLDKIDGIILNDIKDSTPEKQGEYIKSKYNSLKRQLAGV